MSSVGSARSKSPSSKGVVDLRGLNGLDESEQAWMLEIMMFAQNFGVDPAMDHDVMWLVEEAYCAQMPPGWSHHQDEAGRSYFFNVHTEQSSWTHPMDPVFRDLIGYWRSIKAAGGFSVVENELALLEECIREDIGNWVELYDWHGERFYFNQATQESRFDDPRAMRYHDLYTRIRIVSMMREKLPLLAKSVRPNDSQPDDSQPNDPRPIDPLPNDYLPNDSRPNDYLSNDSRTNDSWPNDSADSRAGLIRLEADRQAWAATKIQSLGRAVIARRYVRELRRMKSEPMFVPGPLKSRLKLKQVAGEDLVLMSASAVCPARRRERSAAHIQAWARGRRDRRRVVLMRKHKRHRDRMAARIQRWVRTWDCILALQQRLEARRRNAAATSIQRVARGRQGRAVARDVRRERLHVEQMEHAAVRLQACARGHLGRREAARRKAEHLLENPCRLVFEVMPSEAGQRPWEWKLEMAPITDDLRILPGPPHDLFYQARASYQEALRREAERERAAAAQRAEEERRHRAACRIQARARGNAARMQANGLAEKAGWLLKGFFDYSATGPGSVQLSVTFFPNPHFDRSRYGDADGDEEADAGEGSPETPAAASSAEDADFEVEAGVEGWLQPIEAEQHGQPSARLEQSGQPASPMQRSPAASARSAQPASQRSPAPSARSVQPASQRSPATSARSRQQASPNQRSPGANSRAGQPATPSHRSPAASARAGQPATPSHRSPAASARSGQPGTPSHRSPVPSARSGQRTSLVHESPAPSARSGQRTSLVHESPAPSVRESISESPAAEAAGPGELQSEASARSVRASARSRRSFSQSGKASSRSELLAGPSLEEQATVWSPEFPAAFTSTETWYDEPFMSHVSSKPKLKQSSKVTEYARQKAPGSEALRLLGDTQRANSSPALGPQAKFGGGLEILRAAEAKKAALKERRRRQQPEKQPKQHRQVDPIIEALASKLADKQAFLKYASDRDAMRNRRVAVADKRRLAAHHPVQVPFNSSPAGVMHRHVHHHVHVGQGEGSLPEQLPSIAPSLPSDGLQRAASAGELRGDALRGRPASGGSGRSHRTASKGSSAFLPALVA